VVLTKVKYLEAFVESKVIAMEFADPTLVVFGFIQEIADPVDDKICPELPATLVPS
jgi:hypothetical protein